MEGKNMIQIYKEMSNKLFLLLEKYASQVKEMIELAEKQVYRREYAIGGEAIHRGYYCPSPVLDIVVGNCKRGKLLKRKQKESKYTYEYLFDKNDKLVLVCKYDYNLVSLEKWQVELLIYQDNEVIAFEYDLNNSEITCISQCVYEEERIVEYSRMLMYSEEIQIERFEYENKLLCKSYLGRYVPIKNNFYTEIPDFMQEMLSVFQQKEYFEENKYYFVYDEQKHLIAYSTEELDYNSDVIQNKSNLTMIAKSNRKK